MSFDQKHIILICVAVLLSVVLTALVVNKFHKMKAKRGIEKYQFERITLVYSLIFLVVICGLSFILPSYIYLPFHMEPEVKAGEILALNNKKIKNTAGLVHTMEKAKINSLKELEDKIRKNNLTFDEVFVEEVLAGRTENVIRLLDQKADFNARTSYGTTVLMEAAALGYEDVVRVLLAYGADRDLQTIEGKMAIDFARENFRSSAEKILNSREIISQSDIDIDDRVGFTHVSIDPLIELDRTTLEEIQTRRVSKRRQNLELLHGSFKPNQHVFNRMKDHQAWWGTMVHRDGLGVSSTNGPSEESRYLMNPYILVGVIECQFLKSPRIKSDVESADVNNLLLIPKTLIWDNDRLWSVVSYSAGGFWDRQIKLGLASEYIVGLELSLYNARDYGFQFAAIVEDLSNNVAVSESDLKLHRIKSAVMFNSYCGHPNSCNTSRKRFNHNLKFGIKKLPASLYVKLWQFRPKSVQDDPDMLYLIKFSE